ncbi:MAG: HEAT repeat domain-containing protein [Myxococcales bacterium]|nr:HEAT repeat domain-containing protein [Myxococcales bacterium]
MVSDSRVMHRIIAAAALVALVSSRPANAMEPRPERASGPVPQAPTEPVPQAPTESSSHPQTSDARAGSERTIKVRVCESNSRCVAHALSLPQELGAERLEELHLEGGRPVMLVSAAPLAGPGRYIALLAYDDGAAVELLRGYVDRPSPGEPGERHTKVLRREPRTGDAEALIVATSFEAATACGRPVLMNARRLDPDTFLWEETENRVFSGAERNLSPLFARRMSTGYDALLPRLLVSKVSSSAALGSHGALTDGRLDTSWSENGPRTGAGELVAMSASMKVPIEGFQWVVRTREGERRPAPRTLQFATDAAVYSVTMPEDAWLTNAGASYEVRLPAPITTACVALVLDDAYLGGPEELGIAELRAITSLDAIGTSPKALVMLLDDGGARALAASTLLERGGTAAVHAAIEAYANLGESGRRRALDVIETGACQDSAAFFVERLVGAGQGPAWDPELDPIRERAAGRLYRCREDSRAALAAKLRSGKVEREQILAARALAAIAPGAAVETLAAALAGASTALRRELRRALGAAPNETRARTALNRLFVAADFDARPLAVRIDLLRAAGTQLGGLDGGADALERVAGADLSFNTRYLLQAPLGALAAHGDARAIARLDRAMLSDESPHVRARAADAAIGSRASRAALARALMDDAPRVRTAALRSLGAALGRLSGEHSTQSKEHAKLTPLAPAALAAPALPVALVAPVAPALPVALVAPVALVEPAVPVALERIRELLARDPWTFVRVAAAEALGSAPRALPIQVGKPESAATVNARDAELADESLEAALADGAVSVRRAALLALASRNARGAAESVHRLASDPREPLAVRATAVSVLGELCYADADELLYKLAFRLAAPQLPYDEALGVAALGALGALQPPEFEAKLQPLAEHAKVPDTVRRLTRETLKKRGSCKRTP